MGGECFRRRAAAAHWLLAAHSQPALVLQVYSGLTTRARAALHAGLNVLCKRHLMLIYLVEWACRVA